MAPPDSVLLLDTALRGGAVVLFLFIAGKLLCDRWDSASARLGAAFAVGVVCFTLLTWPAPTPLNHSVWVLPVVALESGNGFLFWLFARKLFDDGFQLRAWHAALWAAFAVLGALNCLVLLPADLALAGPLQRAMALSALAFALLAVVQTAEQGAADLVESRRGLRRLIVGLTAVFTLLNVGSGLWFGPQAAPPVKGLLDALFLLLAAVLVGGKLLQTGAAQLFVLAPVPPAPSPPIPATAVGGPAPPVAGAPLAEPLALAPGDAPSPLGLPDLALVAQLQALMTEAQVFRAPSLTIGALADRMGLHEYQLRRLINQGLGYRNFNAFLNRYRIADTRAALADPARATVPVLKLAMDAGFQSLGPFNRAFKAETGMTPTEFRQRHGVDASPVTDPELMAM